MIIDYHDNWEIILVKKKKCISIIWVKKKGGGGKRGGGDGSGKRGGGGGSSGGGGGSSGGSGGSCGGCKWLWLLFIVVDILFYCSRYISLLWCLYYFIVLKSKIAPLLQHVCR